jgi:hypothetical protein
MRRHHPAAPERGVRASPRGGRAATAEAGCASQRGSACAFNTGESPVLPGDDKVAPRAGREAAPRAQGEGPFLMRVLLVEDDVLIGAAMAADVREIGFDPVGPIRSVAEALQVVEVDGIDLAIVDVRLASGNSADLAAVLKARGIPFAWVTGYSAATFPTLGAPVLVKPVSAHRFQRLLTDLVAGDAHRTERTGSGGA